MFRILILVFTLNLSLFASSLIYEKDLLDFKLSYYLDDSNLLDINSIKDIEFKKLNKNSFALGYQKKTLWLKVDIQNQSSYNKFILSLNEHFYELAELYFFDKTWQKKESGFFMPINEREIQISMLEFNINIDQKSSETIYLKLKGKYSYFGNITIIPIDYFFTKQFFNIQSFYIFALGMVFIIILFNLFLWIKLKEKIYGFYVGYTFFVFIYLITMSSFLVYFNLQEFTYKLNISGAIASSFLALFSLELLKIKKYYKKINYFIYFLIFTLLFSTFMQLFSYYPWNEIISKTISILNITLIFTSFMIYLKGETYVKYYIFALIIFFIFIIMFLLMLSGIIEYSFTARYGYLFALCIELIIFSLLLAQRHNSIKIKQIQTQKELLTLQNNQKYMLEKEVETKTKELRVLVKERELLLKEVFHRVKNNFHMVTAFLYLESKKDKNINRFDELINRIQSMSFIHEYLCQNNNLAQIDSKEYLVSLIKILTKSHKTFKLDLDIDSIIINFDDIISLSTIINELIGNSIKHNLNSSLNFEIKFKQKNSTTVEFFYKDNGDGFDITKIKKGFGLKLLHDFTQKLLDANYRFENHKGSFFVLEFKLRREP